MLKITDESGKTKFILEDEESSPEVVDEREEKPVKKTKEKIEEVSE